MGDPFYQADHRLSGLGRLAEAGAICLGALGIYLMIALVSFNPADPSWSQTAWQGDIHNAAGTFGAYTADILLFAFGFIGYSAPFICALLAWALFWRPCPVAQLNFFTLGLRVLGFTLTLLSSTALASINVDDFFYFTSGGVVGDILALLMVPVFGLLGTTIILLALLACGVTLFTGMSWVHIVERIGGGLISGVGRVKQMPESRRQKKLQEQHDDVLMRDYNKAPSSDSAEPVQVDEPSFDTQPTADASSEENYNWLTDSAPELPEDAIQDWHNADEPEGEPQEPILLEREHVGMDELMGSDAPVAKPKAKAATPTAATAPVKAQPKLPALPEMTLLDRPDKQQNPISQEDLDNISRLVEAKLADFAVKAKVVAVHPGPVITRFELDLAPGVKVSKISNLSKDLARALSAISVRVVEVIPGKSVIGLELPNRYREVVYLSEVIDNPVFHNSKSALTMVLGKDIAGQPVVVDLAKMPHLLVAGTTGSGKSVGVNVMILSLLYKSTPDDVRLIMIDPKMLELSVYEGIPHLLAEVVTDMKEAANALRWCVGEMERRYKLMSALGVRNLKGYNQKVLDAAANGTPIADPLWKPGDSMDEMPPHLEKLPSIVVVIDEFADMMMIVGKKVEELIARIAQKARAAGIHLVLATQRPSVDVITGLIKANIPTRIAFQVSSKIDSRTILDQQGAETLLGMGDMLYLPAGTGVPTRVHGAFVDDHEVHAVVAAWKERGEPNYIDEILSGEAGPDALLPGEQAEGDEELDELYDQAVAFVTESRRGSVSGVQRQFRIGYNRAARIVEQMEMQGVVSSPGHNGNREVLAPPPVKLD